MGIPTSENPFVRKPLEMRQNIPVFSGPDEYTDNYRRIASDHVAAMAPGRANPWIEDDFWRGMEQSTRLLLREHAPAGARVLDVGVGLGRLLGECPEYERHGMDISFEYLERAAAAGIRVCLARIEDMPYRKEFFDAVVCTDVLEHVLDLNLCVGRILAVLRPGGPLIVRVPYREDLGMYAEPSYPYRLAHLRNFDEHSLRLLFERIFGCQTVSWDTWGCLPGRRWLRYPVPWRHRDRLLERGLALAARIDRSLHDRLARALYRPVVISMVVRKP